MLQVKITCMALHLWKIFPENLSASYVFKILFQQLPELFEGWTKDAPFGGQAQGGEGESSLNILYPSNVFFEDVMSTWNKCLI